MKLQLVNKDIRFYNYVIDLAAILFITLVAGSLIHAVFQINQGLTIMLLLQVVYIAYYFVMELRYGQTLGKMFTKTMVVHKSGRKPSVGNLIIRSMFRIATLDVLSFLLGTAVGMHDSFSNTRVVKLDAVDWEPSFRRKGVKAPAA